MDHAVATMAARGHERAVSHLYRHMGIFVVVIACLTALDVSTGSSFWVQWVVLGWGAGLALHALLVVREEHSEAVARTRPIIPPSTETLKARPPEVLPDPPFETPDGIP